jgi:hypothetical protein
VSIPTSKKKQPISHPLKTLEIPMPFYHKLGEIPHKRHVQFKKPAGRLYRKELMGLEGVLGMRSLFFVLSIFLMLVMSACNLPNASSGLSINDQAATIVAMTLQAAQAVENTPTTQTILNTPTAISIVTKSGGPAKLTVTDNTNCRSGPGTNYSKVTTIPGSTTVTIVARYATGDFWIVTPADGLANCWVQAGLGTVTGDTTILPRVTPVPSENKNAPARPGSLYYEYSCPFGNLSTVLTWADNADNETGYRVYRDNQQIVELPANSKTYTDDTTIIVGTSINYSVEAFNEVGASEQRTISFKCQ